MTPRLIITHVILAFVFIVQQNFAHGQTNLFATAFTVNGTAVSNYEIDQKIRFLRILGEGGDIRGLAEEELIKEKIFIQETKRVGLELTSRQVLEAATDFAENRNTTLEGFLNQIGRAGVTKDTYFGYIESQFAWAEFAREAFGPIIRNLPVPDVDEKLLLEYRTTNTLVNLLEIVLRVDENNPNQAQQIAEEIYRSIKTPENFSLTARNYSASSTRNEGGAVGWLNIDNISGTFRNVINRTTSGNVSEPVRIDDLYYIFFVLDKRTESSAANFVSIEYATLRINSLGADLVANIQNTIEERNQTCDDFSEYSRQFDSELFARQTVDRGDLDEFATPLAGLDNNEVTRVALADESIFLVMLCKRNLVADDEIRQRVLNNLRDRKIDDMARNHFAKLRAAAIVRRK